MKGRDKGGGGRDKERGKGRSQKRASPSIIYNYIIMNVFYF